MRFNVLKEILKEGIQGLKMNYFSSRKDRFGYFASTSSIRTPFSGVKQNVFIHEHCGINSDAKFICQAGKFTMHRNCSVGPGFTVITSNHKYNKVGQRPETTHWGELEPNDVIVHEDVWIGANVTLCPGTIINRGCIVAAGSVCIRNNTYPPYSIIAGNPARFIKFRLTLEEQIQQENLLYKENERISIKELQYNWDNIKSK